MDEYQQSLSHNKAIKNFRAILVAVTLSNSRKLIINMELVSSPLTQSEKIGDPDQIRTGDLSLDRAVC